VLAGLLAVALLELVLLILVGRQIGAGWTILALLALCLVGGWLVKRESGRTWRSLRRAVDSGTMPTRDLADAGLILVGGLLLLFPGFVTGVLGLFLILPFTRPVGRAWLAAVVGSRVLDGVVPGTLHGGPGQGPRPGSGGAPGPRRPGRRSGDGDIVEGEIVDEDPPPDR
jgi:UPF0716 protein FxsA